MPVEHKHKLIWKRSRDVVSNKRKLASQVVLGSVQRNTLVFEVSADIVVVEDRERPETTFHVA